MNWKHGYYAEGGYTFGYYPETMPSRLRWASLVHGHNPQPTKFRYLDAGCGQGLNLIFAAAAHPDSEFIGIDFLPEHVAHGTKIANSCGISNVTFLERDFLELAADPEALGEFDYVICHGITTWIAPKVKAALFKYIGQALKPGGLFYNSYNTFPGWLGSVPFQHLVMLEQKTNNGLNAIRAATESIKILQDCASGMLKSLPALETRINILSQQDSAYLVQEYNNAHWQPAFVSQMIETLAEEKITYVGTATLPEAYDNLLPQKIRELLKLRENITIREQLRDYAINQSFRRDLYVKGYSSSWPGEIMEQFSEFFVSRNPLKDQPQPGKPYTVHSGAGETHGDRKFYDSIISKIESEQNRISVGKLVSDKKDPRERLGVLQAVSMLLFGGWLLPETTNNPNVLENGRALNKHLSKAVSDGAPYRYVAVPKFGGAFPISDVQWLLLDCANRGIKPIYWLKEVKQALKRLNRKLHIPDKQDSDEISQDKMIENIIIDFKENWLPLLNHPSSEKETISGQ